MQAQDDRLLTVREVATWLRVSNATAYALVREGKLKSVRVGTQRGAIRVRAADVNAYLQSSANMSEWKEKPRPPRVLLKHLRLHRLRASR